MGDVTYFQTTGSGNADYYASYFSDKGFGNYDAYWELTTHMPNSLDAWNAFQYDNAQRLTEMQNYTAFSHAYDYDDIGNWNSHTLAGVQKNFSTIENSDGSSKIISPSSTWEFNIKGDLKSKNGKVAKFDGFGRLIEYDGSRYTYNPAGQRIIKFNAQTNEYTYFDYDLEGNLIVERTELNGIITNNKRYVYLENRLVALVDYDQFQVRRYYTVITNHLGAPIMLVNDSGNSVWEMLYSPFGGVHHIYESGVTFNLRLPGQYYDQESGFHYNMARYYDPEMGRYISSDPLGMVDGPNTYSYALNNPINFIDPTGLFSSSEEASEHAQATINECWDPINGCPLDFQVYPTDMFAVNDICRMPQQGDFDYELIYPKAGIEAIFTGPKKGISKSLKKKRFSDEKQALVDMAKKDKKTGITAEDMQAYKDLNKQLQDPFPSNKVRGPESHPSRTHGKEPHGHVGPVNHIPIITR